MLPEEGLTLRRSAVVAAMLSAVGVLAGCGTSKPTALPGDEAFRSCLTSAGISPDKLESLDARRDAFEKPAPWDCVLALDSASERHDVLEGVFPPDSAALLKAMTAWVATQKGDGSAIAESVGTLVAAADDPLPDDAAKASLRSDLDDEFQSVLSLAIYQHCDGELRGYSAYMARPDLKGDPSAPNRYFQDLMDKGGAVADRLRSYAATIDARRDALRVK